MNWKLDVASYKLGVASYTTCIRCGVLYKDIHIVCLICHQVLLVIELLAKEDLREHLLSLRPEYVVYTTDHP